MSQHPNNRPHSGQELVSRTPQGKNSNAESSGSADDILREMQEEVSPEATPLWQFVNDNAPKIATIVVALVVIISTFAFYQGHQESSLEDARIELSIITSNPQDAERLTLLEAYKNEAPEEILLGIEFEIAQTAILLGDFAKAQIAFSTVIEREGNSPLGISATINLADILAYQGESQKAIDMYESIVNHVPLNFRVSVYASIAEVATVANLKEKALSAYKDALNALPETDSDSQDAEYFNAKIMQLS